MRERKHNDTARQQGDPAPQRSRLARGEIVAVLLAVLFVISLFLTPQSTWVVGLLAGLILLAVAIALGLRLWARDRTIVDRAPQNGEPTHARTGAPLHVAGSPSGDDRP